MEKHVDLVAWLNIGHSALMILIAGLAFMAIVGGGLIGGFASGETKVITITAIVGSAIAAFLVLLSVPGIVGGVWLLKRHSWARILVLVLAFLRLIDFPLGTALGIYTIYVLMNDETVPLFAPGV